MSRRPLQLEGKRFGKLLVIARAEPPTSHKDEHVHWSCKCDCGNTSLVSSSNLNKGKNGVRGCRNCSYAVKTNPWFQVYGLYQRNAKKTGKDFFLSEELFAKLISQPCDYCGQAPSQKLWQGTHDTGRQEFRWNGLDRIDSSKGYTEDNVVPCCKTCNAMKSDKTREEFLSAIEAIYRWQAR